MEPVAIAAQPESRPVTPAPQRAGKIALIGATLLTVIYALMVIGQRGVLDLVGLVFAWATYAIVVFVVTILLIVGWRAMRS